MVGGAAEVRLSTSRTCETWHINGIKGAHETARSNFHSNLTS